MESLLRQDQQGKEHNLLSLLLLWNIIMLLSLLDMKGGDEDTGILPLHKLLYFVNKRCASVSL